MRDAEALIAAAHDLLAAAAPELSRPWLVDWPHGAPPRALPPHRLPVLQWLPQAAMATVQATAALTALVIRAAPALDWRQTYAETDFGARFLARYGWTELLGLRGVVVSTRIACGILMLGPDTHYPSHCHAAEEIYLPLSGTALWRRDGDAWAERPPGQPIHHPPWLSHAMRTQAEPLLALYLWRGGDLAQKSLLVGRDRDCQIVPD